MNLFTLSSLGATIFFGIAAIAISLKEERKKAHQTNKEDNTSSTDQVKDEYIHMIVHELRGPLTAIQDSTKLIMMYEDTLSKSERRKLLQLINEQSKKMLEQVSSLLDAAKLQAGKFSVHKKPSDIKQE